MIISSYRIINKKFAKETDHAKGSELYGGRWNNPGTRIIYSAESTSLAHLEQLAITKTKDLINSFVYIKFDFDDSLVKKLPNTRLIKGWDSIPHPKETKMYGDAWAKKQTSLVLKVPSSVNKLGNNYLFNVIHSEYKSVKIHKPKPFKIDNRFL